MEFNFPLEKRMALLFDCDLTTTERYMQIHLIEKSLDNIKHHYNGMTAKDGSTIQINEPLDYFIELVDRWGVKHNGIAYVSQILHDIRIGVFPKFTNEDLREFGKDIELSPGMPEFFDNLRNKWKDECDIKFYIVSVGLKAMIEGSPLAKYVDGIYATELVSLSHQYHEIDKPILDSMATATVPFNKSQCAIEIAKGGRENLDKLMNHAMYVYDYRNMFYFGDGISDISVSAYLRNKNAWIQCVYGIGDTEAFERIFNNKNVRDRAHALVQRDYRVGSKLWLHTNNRIKKNLNRKCDFNPVLLNMHKKEKFRPNPDKKIIEVINEHVMECPECNGGLFEFYWQNPTPKY